MTVHLKKLSVGSKTVADLQRWQQRCLAAGHPIIHPTRNWPRRADELLDGGSLFWIIKGQMVVRQPIAELIEIKREDGRPACGIVLQPGLVHVWPRRVRIFQGWRYLETDDAPQDMPTSETNEAMPEKMAKELREMGLL